MLEAHSRYSLRFDVSPPRVVFPEQLPVVDTLRGFKFIDRWVAIVPVDANGLHQVRMSVPEGYEFDGATIPWFAQLVIGKPKDPMFQWASLVHDLLCDASATYQDREINDSLFLFLLYRSQVSGWRRRAMWLGVRFHSRFVWRPKKCDSFSLSGSLLRQLSRLVPRWLRR